MQLIHKTFEMTSNAWQKRESMSGQMLHVHVDGDTPAI